MIQPTTNRIQPGLVLARDAAAIAPKPIRGIHKTGKRYFQKAVSSDEICLFMAGLVANHKRNRVPNAALQLRRAISVQVKRKGLLEKHANNAVSCKALLVARI